MKGDPKVIDYLNKGLRSELTAINQYWLHFRLLDNWGLKEMSKVWRKESIEEMHHADRFTDRILFLDGFPNMQVLDPLRIGQNVKEIIECDLAAHDARELPRFQVTAESRPGACAPGTWPPAGPRQWPWAAPGPASQTCGCRSARPRCAGYCPR